MLSPYEILFRLLLGALLGGIIGFEREIHGRPAGFRTQLLVSVSAVLLMIVSEHYHYLAVMDPSYVRVDPGRIAQGAITGVGFLGAGVILKTGLNIQGLTTAACLWIVSAIGIAIGAGLYAAAVSAFFITFLALWGLRLIEPIIPSLRHRYVSITLSGEGREHPIEALLQKHKLKATNMSCEKDLDAGTVQYDFSISLKQKAAPSVEDLLEELAALSSVKKVAIRS